MPYDTIASLPEKIKKHLPVHGQHIYLNAFNNALNEYKKPEKKRDKKEDSEKIAHKVAWNAVKKMYQKDKETGKWTRIK